MAQATHALFAMRAEVRPQPPPINICVYSNIETDSWRYGPSYAVSPGGVITFPLYVQNKGNNDIGVRMSAYIETSPVAPAYTGNQMATQVLINNRRVHAGQGRAFNAGLTTRRCFSGVSCSLASTWVLDSAGEPHLSCAVAGLAGTDGRPAYPLPYGEYRILLSFSLGVFGTSTSDWTGLADQSPNITLDVVSSVRQLTISRHNTVTLTNAEADSILSEASTVLVVSDGQDDVACPVALVRSGDVRMFNKTDGSIDTRTERDEVFKEPGNVKVVGNVNCCEDIVDPFTGDTICKIDTIRLGCGKEPDTIGGPCNGGDCSFIMERPINDGIPFNEGILWAHEFGHNQGLHHRNDSTNNVMNEQSNATSRRVNEVECNAFKGQKGQTAATEAITRTQTSTVGGEPIPVEEFVTKIYLHGLPLAQAATYQ